MSTFRDIKVWQKAMCFVTEIYKVSQEFPRDEQFGLTSQIRRDAVSIPSNISEGFGRGSVNDYLRFLNIPLASLLELQTQLEIAYNLNYLQNNIFDKLYELSRKLERMLSSFIRVIKNKNR